MVKYLSTRQVSANIEEIISGAEKFIVLVSPYIKVPDALLQRVDEAVGRSVRTILIGTGYLKPAVKASLDKIKKLEIYFVPYLHAKCYFNEKQMVLATMNFYDFSEVHNWEMGLLIGRNQDPELYDSITHEVIRMLKSLNPPVAIDFGKTTSYVLGDETNWPELVEKFQVKQKHLTALLAQGKGFCIGCGDKIPFNDERPYCIKCFRAWSQYIDDREKFCHLCGKDAVTTFEHPICLNCMKKIMERIGSAELGSL